MKTYWASFKDTTHLNEIVADNISDGHHTMDELYEHRHALFCALLKAYDHYITPLNFPHVRCWKSKKHNDGTMYDGWFIAGISKQKIPFNNIDNIEIQHIAYHLPISYWGALDVQTLEQSPPYDGFHSREVLHRLMQL